MPTPEEAQNKELDRKLSALNNNSEYYNSMSIFRILSDRLIESLNKNASSANRLSCTLIWLNVIMTIGTLVAVWIAVMMFLRPH
ncbi:MAG: hypothetical protein C0417_08930 [Chlorobiaceae bacterium]|nr:hypothetical protein [Chlorobiaceae bacterium]